MGPPQTMLRRISITILAAALLVGGAGAARAQEGGPEEAWAKLKGRVELFWKAKEESPHEAKAEAFSLIDALRSFVYAWPRAPQVPEAYYIMGHAYAQAGYWPEAIGHWRIVTKNFPESPWAGEALMAILTHLEESGRAKRYRRFFLEIIRQHPDTTAAKAAWLILVSEVLKAGNLEKVKRELSRLERADPKVYVKVPLFLDVRARIRFMEGDYRGAREDWLHFLNLTQSRAQQAKALFRIAETYRKEGKVFFALKYYAICARDYRETPQADFSRFRIAQLREKVRLGKAVGRRREESAAWLYERIMKRYPHHPLTQEVEIELMEVRLRQDLPLEALRLAEHFLTVNGESSYAERVWGLAEKARRALAVMPLGPDALSKAVSFAREAQRGKAPERFRQAMRETERVLLRRLVSALLENGRPEEAVERAEEMRRNPDWEEEGRALERRALLAADRARLESKDPLGLLDYHNRHRRRFEELGEPGHFLFLASACEELGLHALSRASYARAWELGARGDWVLRWADLALRTGRPEEAGTALELYEDATQGALTSPGVRGLWLRIYAREKRWEDALGVWEALGGREGAGALGPEALEAALSALSMLGRWDEAFGLLDESFFPERGRASGLRLLGAQALRTGYYEVAVEEYTRLRELLPEDPAASFRLAAALWLEGRPGDAKREWKALSEAGEGIWSRAAAAFLASEAFWETEAADFAWMRMK